MDLVFYQLAALLLKFGYNTSTSVVVARNQNHGPDTM